MCIFFFRDPLDYLNPKGRANRSEASTTSSYGQYDSKYVTQEEILAYLAGEDKRYLSGMGHQFDDMVKSCTFNGVSCR